MQRAKGFTLIEMLIVVVIAAILLRIAIPQYFTYIQRGNVVAGTQALTQYRVQMEQYYQDNGNYGTGGACGAPLIGGLVNFTMTCTLSSAQSYQARMSGNAGGPVSGFVYWIDQGNNQWTSSLGSGWTLTSAGSTSWVVR